MRNSLVAAIVAALPLSAASAQTINNGTLSLAVPSNGTGNGWTSSNVDGAGGWRSSGGNPDGMFILNDNGNSSTDPTLSQTITGLVIGNQYQVTGQYASAIANGSGQQAFLVLMDGAVLFTGTSGPVGNWRDFAGVFTATGTSMTLELHGEALGTDYDFAVDNISIGTVPAPGAAGLLTLGLIAGARRRR